jgi:hypothetical protein
LKRRAFGGVHAAGGQREVLEGKQAVAERFAHATPYQARVFHHQQHLPRGEKALLRRSRFAERHEAGEGA